MLKDNLKFLGMSAVFLFLASMLIIWFISPEGNDKTISEARENYEIVLVDFWADGCKPCKKISPFIDEISKEYLSVKVIKVDINSEDGLHEKYDIRFVPTVIVFYQGEVFERFVGFHEKEEYTRCLDGLMSPDDVRMSKFIKYEETK